MKKDNQTATERARNALDAIEQDFFKVQTGLRAGNPPSYAENDNGRNANNPWSATIQPLYGVIIEEV